MPKYGDRKRYFDRLVRSRATMLARSGRSRDARRVALALLRRDARNGAGKRA
jgi:hypothetical protein